MIEHIKVLFKTMKVRRELEPEINVLYKALLKHQEVSKVEFNQYISNYILYSTIENMIKNGSIKSSDIMLQVAYGAKDDCMKIQRLIERYV